MPITNSSRVISSMIVFASTPLSCTVLSHHGTPKEDTYHQAFQPASVSDMMNATAASASVRLRAERSAICDSTTAPSAAAAAPRPA